MDRNSYGGSAPRRSAPLIARPSAAAPPPPPPRGQPASALTSSIQGALGGMGLHHAPPSSYTHSHPPTYSAYSAPSPHQLGLSAAPWPSNAYFGPVMQTHPQSYYPQQGAPYYGYPTPPAPVTSSNYPAPPASYPHALGYPSSSASGSTAAPFGAYPYPAYSAATGAAQTTPDGYTLSSTYSAPSAAPSSSSASRSRGPRPRPPQQGPPPPSRDTRSLPPSSSDHGPRPPPSHHQQRASANAAAAASSSQPLVCSSPGCTFTAPSRKLVREHEEDRHLLFAPGREPQKWDGSLKPKEGAVIEGTGIALDTPEALARWIEERKKRWPSKKVVEEKERARAQRVAAGLEAPSRADRAARGRGRGHGLAGTMGDARGRGRGRGGGVGGWGAPHPEERHATADAPEGGKGAGESTGRTERDAASTADGEQEEEDGELRAAKRARLDEGTAAITGEAGRAPASVASDGSDASTSDDSEEEDDDHDDEEDDAPEEVSTKPEAMRKVGDGADRDDDNGPEHGGPPGEESASLESSATGPQKRFQVVCRHWRRGNCGLGEDCPYLHELPANAPPPPPPPRRRPAPPRAPHNPFARPPGYSDAFSLLEERDHKHIVSDVLQVIEFLGANGWLRGVELRRGQVEEESGIEVLASSSSSGAAVAGTGSVAEGQVEGRGEGTEPIQGNGGGDLPRTLPTAAGQSAVVEEDVSKYDDTEDAGDDMNHEGESKDVEEEVHVPATPTPVGAIAVPTSAPASGLGAMLVDYSSDTDDEAEDATVAAALTGRAGGSTAAA